MKQFVSTVHKRAKRPLPEEGFGRRIDVDIDGREVGFGGVTPSQMVAMVAMEAQGERGRLATMINFFYSVILDENDRAWLKSRLFDPDDEFGEEMVADITIYLLQEWGERPTEPSLDSSDTPERTGQSSTENSQGRASTRSRSRSTGS